MNSTVVASFSPSCLSHVQIRSMSQYNVRREIFPVVASTSPSCLDAIYVSIRSVAASISPSCLPDVQMRSMSQYNSSKCASKNTKGTLCNVSERYLPRERSNTILTSGRRKIRRRSLQRFWEISGRDLGYGCVGWNRRRLTRNRKRSTAASISSRLSHVQMRSMSVYNSTKCASKNMKGAPCNVSERSLPATFRITNCVQRCLRPKVQSRLWKDQGLRVAVLHLYWLTLIKYLSPHPQSWALGQELAVHTNPFGIQLKMKSIELQNMTR